MKKNTTKLFAMLLLFALVVTALSSCGIVFSAEYRFGLAIIENESSKIAAAVIIDSHDRIALVRIDEIQNGNNTSKKDLGDKYNMKSASKIGSEWYEQIAYLERELVGKKIDFRGLFPWFILGFLALAAINSTGIIPAEISGMAKGASKFLMVSALAAIGLGTSFQDMKKAGLNPMLHGFIISALVVVVAIAVEWCMGMV